MRWINKYNGNSTKMSPKNYHGRLDMMKNIHQSQGGAHLCANWIAFPPTPVKESIMIPLPQRDAWCLAIDSGVTENHPSSSILMPPSNLENNRYLCHQYLPILAEYCSSIPWKWSPIMEFNNLGKLIKDKKNFSKK